MVLDKGKDDSNEPKPWRENEAWRKRPITEKQAMLLKMTLFLAQWTPILHRELLVLEGIQNGERLTIFAPKPFFENVTRTF